GCRRNEKMRLSVALSLVVGLQLSPALSFAQSPSLLGAAAFEEAVRLQPPSLLDAVSSEAESAVNDADSLASEDSEPSQNGSSGGTVRAKPSPTTSGAAVATTYVFPTNGEMNRYWLKNTLGPKALIGATFSASWNQWVTDNPSEWSKDFTGWSQRYGA